MGGVRSYAPKSRVAVCKRSDTAPYCTFWGHTLALSDADDDDDDIMDGADDDDDAAEADDEDVAVDVETSSGKCVGMYIVLFKSAIHAIFRAPSDGASTWVASLTKLSVM